MTPMTMAWTTGQVEILSIEEQNKEPVGESSVKVGMRCS